MDDKVVMNPIVADFCGLLESRSVPYELNDNDANMIRFRTKLPHHEVAPYVFIHYNPDNQALTLALNHTAKFTSVGMDLYQVINDFNADSESFGCKMYIEHNGELVVLTSAVLGGKDRNDIRDQLEDYLNVAIVSLDKYYGRISEIIQNSNKN